MLLLLLLGGLFIATAFVWWCLQQWLRGEITNGATHEVVAEQKLMSALIMREQEMCELRQSFRSLNEKLNEIERCRTSERKLRAALEAREQELRELKRRLADN